MAAIIGAASFAFSPLLGQFALGVRLLYGVSVSSALAVALTMATSLTFLPALLGFLGPKVLSRRERAALASYPPVAGDAGGFLDPRHPRRGIVLDPSRQMGQRWCRGRFTGSLTYYRAYACPSHGTCRPPAGFRARRRSVARISFRIGG